MMMMEWSYARTATRYFASQLKPHGKCSKLEQHEMNVPRMHTRSQEPMAPASQLDAIRTCLQQYAHVAKAFKQLSLHPLLAFQSRQLPRSPRPTKPRRPGKVLLQLHLPHERSE